MIVKRFSRGSMMTALLVAVVMSANSADFSGNDDWELGTEVPLWGAFIGTKAARENNIHISYSDTARWGRLPLPGFPVRADTGVDMKAWVVTMADGYTVTGRDGFSPGLPNGQLFLSREADEEFELGAVNRKTSKSGRIWKGILGVRSKADLTDNWYFSTSLDAGDGAFDLNWQGQAGLNYKFRNAVAGFGYRYLNWDVDNSAVDDLVINGPYAGVKFKF